MRRTPRTSTPSPSSSTRPSSRSRRASPAARPYSPAPTTARGPGPAPTAWPKTCAATASGCARRRCAALDISTRRRSCPTAARRRSSLGSGRAPSPARTPPAGSRCRWCARGGWGRRRARRPTSSRRSSGIILSTPSGTIRRTRRRRAPLPEARDDAWRATPSSRMRTSADRRRRRGSGSSSSPSSPRATGREFILSRHRRRATWRLVPSVPRTCRLRWCPRPTTMLIGCRCTACPRGATPSRRGSSWRSRPSRTSWERRASECCAMRSRRAWPRGSASRRAAPGPPRTPTPSPPISDSSSRASPITRRRSIRGRATRRWRSFATYSPVRPCPCHGTSPRGTRSRTRRGASRS